MYENLNFGQKLVAILYLSGLNEFNLDTKNLHGFFNEYRAELGIDDFTDNGYGPFSKILEQGRRNINSCGGFGVNLMEKNPLVGVVMKDTLEKMFFGINLAPDELNELKRIGKLFKENNIKLEDD